MQEEGSREIPSIITTADGSHSLHLALLDENYHSVHGAIQESLHVYIEAGLRHRRDKPGETVEILELGLGTGLNVLLTLSEAEQTKLKVRYTSLEPFPLEASVVSQLNYPLMVNVDKELFERIHLCAYDTEVELQPDFFFIKVLCRIQDFNSADKFDMVYFDAFGPRVQPELWEYEIFQKVFGALKPGGILVTYCSKGQVRRNMQAAGFVVEKLKGPPGKREMLRARRDL